jgi:hypothetical protein
MSQSIPLSDLESSPSAKWDNIGDKYVGRIISMDPKQQTDTNGNPRTFPSGDPMMLWIIVLEQTNGDRVALWAKAGRFKAVKGEGESMLNAIGAAVRAAGASGVDMGAELAVQYTGEGEKQPGKNAPKLFKAEYRPPAAASVPVEDLFSE